MSSILYLVTRVVKSDPTILALGEQLTLKHAHDKGRYAFIHNQLLERGRLVRELRKDTEHVISDLASCINPIHFDRILVATRELCGFIPGTNTYATPSLALKVGHGLKKCAYILKGRAIAACDELLITQVSRYLELNDMQWTGMISFNALRMEKKNTITMIPLSEDVKRLVDHLKDAINSSKAELEEEATNKSAFSSLQQSLLSLLVVFNRRRCGEVSKMLLTDVQGMHSSYNLAQELETNGVERKC